MKVLALVTYTDCENKYRSLQSLGHEVIVEQYDNRPHNRHAELIEMAKSVAPDFILYIGAIEQYHGRPCPQPDILRAINQVSPMIHMCDDAADKPWWPSLEQYDREKCFTIQVAIDGVLDTPISSFNNGMTLLTPIDFRPFKPKPWNDRTIKTGMVGGMGYGPRQQGTEALQKRGVLDFRQGPIGRSYDEMAQIMCDTKITYNYGMKGSCEGFHVKGRVIEAGFAGCCLLETKDSPASKWFKPGIDYLEYENADDAAWIITNTADSSLQFMAHTFHNRVVKEHHPQVFWNKILEKIDDLAARA
jgi:hypothetical protein